MKTRPINRGRFSIRVSLNYTTGPARCLKSQHDERIIEFLSDYFNSLILFTAQYYRFKSEQKVQFVDIDSLVENHVFYLRESSMYLFDPRNSINGDTPSPQAQLLQLIIGSIFHEILRLKQYLYVLETHQVRVAALEESLEVKYFLLRHGKALVQEAESKLPSLMEELRELWEEANTFFHQWIPQFADNRVILRYLFRNQILIDRAYGYGGFENLLKCLFEHGLEDGFFRVGMDYYRSSHRDEALECFEHLLDLYEGKKRTPASPTSSAPRLPKGTRAKRLREILKCCQSMQEFSQKQRLRDAGRADQLAKFFKRLETHLAELETKPTS